MKDISWLTPELIEATLAEFASKAYKNSTPHRIAARHIADVIQNSAVVGDLALQVLLLTPDITAAALVLISSGVQLGMRLYEVKDGEPWLMKKKTN